MKEKIRTAFMDFKSGKTECKQLLTYFKKLNLFDSIIQLTSFMGSDLKKYNFRHRLYMILNDLDNFPNCIKCGKPNTRQNIWFDNTYEMKENSLCYKCMNLEKAKRASQTVFETYGVYNVSNIPGSQEKKNSTCFQNYGVINPSKSEIIQRRTRNTNLRLYGVTHWMKSKKNIKEFEDIIFSLYGVRNISYLEGIEEKKELTSLGNCGETHWTKTKEGRKFQSDNMTKNSGMIHEKSKKTYQNELGVDHWMKSEENLKQFKDDIHRKIYKKTIENHDKLQLLCSEDEFVNNFDGKFKWKCKICGFEFEDYRTIAYEKHNFCPNCHPKLSYNISSQEREIVDYIKTYTTTDIITNTKKEIAPLELDIFLPEFKVAFEFDGGYWHSTKYKSPLYHLEKTTKCNEKNIQLYHIFEQDWYNKNGIIKNRIRNIIQSFEISDIHNFHIVKTIEDCITVYHVFYNNKEICSYDVIVNDKDCCIFEIKNFLSCYKNTNELIINYLKNIENINRITVIDKISWPMWNDYKNYDMIINSVSEPSPYQIIKNNLISLYNKEPREDIIFDCGEIHYLWERNSNDLH